MFPSYSRCENIKKGNQCDFYCYLGYKKFGSITCNGPNWIFDDPKCVKCFKIKGMNDFKHANRYQNKFRMLT